VSIWIDGITYMGRHNEVPKIPGARIRGKYVRGRQ